MFFVTNFHTENSSQKSLLLRSFFWQNSFGCHLRFKKRRIHGGRSPPKSYESNLIHHNFLKFGKQHLRHEAILLSIVLSQQFCEACFNLLAVAKPLWDLTAKHYWNRPPTSLAGSAPGFMTTGEDRNKDWFKNWKVCCLWKLPFRHHGAKNLTQICICFNNLISIYFFRFPSLVNITLKYLNVSTCWCVFPLRL